MISEEGILVGPDKIKATIDWQKKVNEINKKMEQILAEKKAKK